MINSYSVVTQALYLYLNTKSEGEKLVAKFAIVSAIGKVRMALLNSYRKPKNIRITDLQMLKDVVLLFELGMLNCERKPCLNEKFTCGVTERGLDMLTTAKLDIEKHLSGFVEETNSYLT